VFPDPITFLAALIKASLLKKQKQYFMIRTQPKESRSNMEAKMKTEYDFQNAEKNPYVEKQRKQITIRIDVDTIEYFKNLAKETGIKYQNLINLYLSDCAEHEKTIKIAWK
jgi:uncharacterized protein (DUF4415 family)